MPRLIHLPWDEDGGEIMDDDVNAVRGELSWPNVNKCICVFHSHVYSYIVDINPLGVIVAQ